MDCSLKIKSGIKWTVNMEEWLEKMERISSGTVLRTGCIVQRPDLKLKETSKKKIISIDLACPNEYKKVAKRDEKIGTYNQLFWIALNYEINEVKVIPTVIRCLGGERKELQESIRKIFKYDSNDKELETVSWEMQKTVLWERKFLIRKVLPALFTWGILT